jgi:predicted regulator of Ras-like GTPase activity (Roadblock/LC7/MglB family)
MREQVIETMKQYFLPTNKIEIYYRSSSIFDQSIYLTVGEMIQKLILQNTKAKTVSGAIQEFIQQHTELSGIAVYTDDGLPVFEEGELAERIVLPANLWLTNYDRIKDEFATGETFKTTLETDEFVFVFQRIKDELLLTGIAKKVAPLHYVLVKMEQIATIVSDLL